MSICVLISIQNIGPRIPLKVPSRNLVRSLHLVSLQNGYCKLAALVKRGLLEISRRASYRNIPCTC